MQNVQIINELVKNELIKNMILDEEKQCERWDETHNWAEKMYYLILEILKEKNKEMFY